MIYEGKKIIKHRDFENTSSNKYDLDFVSENELKEVITKVRFGLDTVIYWEEHVDIYFPFKYDSKKTKVILTESLAIILIEDVDRFTTIMEDFYEKLNTQL